jgi:tail assembly chaperone E/41/14-like protein
MAGKKAAPQVGSVDIQLRTPIKVSGVITDRLQMREPTVGDHVAQTEYRGSEAAKEIFLFSSLLQITPDEVKGLSLHDYKKAQEALTGFID